MKELFVVLKKGGALNCVAWDKSHPDLKFAVVDSFGLGDIRGLFIHEGDAEKFAAAMNISSDANFIKNILTLTKCFGGIEQ